MKELKERDSAGRMVMVALAVLVGVAAGVGALLGAAVLTSRPPLFLIAGLSGFCAVYLLGLLFATHKVGQDRRRPVRVVSFFTGTALVVGLFVLAALLPMDDPRLPPAPVEGQRYWELSTGSRIAYVSEPAEGDARRAPVIFLHGGPGTPDMKGDSEYFGRLARSGFDVYVYDEVGTGRSSRLQDPTGYSLTRDVADLEAVREKIGAERVALIGHSYGGTLAAAYASLHPEHVARMILSSPGDPSPSAGGASMVYRLATGEKLEVYALLLPPRPMLAYALLQVNPEAAHAFASDAELDARQDRIYNRTRPALHCRNQPPGPRLHGLGFFANQYPQSAARKPHADFLPDLEGLSIPTLVIKGRCDYLSWSSAQEYLKVLPDARLLYLRDSGHNAYQDEPERYMSEVRAFLLDRPLPEHPYAGSNPPEGYEGPP
jgi:proline iminopeptidase